MSPLRAILGGSLAVALLIIASPARAADEPSAAILLRPSDVNGNALGGTPYFRITARPGAHVALHALVGNTGSAGAGITLRTVDARTGPNGGVSYDLPQARPTRVGAWVRLARTRLSLSPRQSDVVGFSVAVPARAAPGQYVGALTAYVPVRSSIAGKGIDVTVQVRTFAAIVVSIPGRVRADLQVRRVAAEYRSGSRYAIVHLRNDGNVLLQASGSLRLLSMHAKKLLWRRDFSIDTTVPGTGFGYPIPWPRRVTRGSYRYAVALSWRAGRYTSDTGLAVFQWRSGHFASGGAIRVA